MTTESYTKDIKSLIKRERFRDTYWKCKDPIIDQRLGWRSQTFRHLVHCLPSDNILEVGAGNGEFSQKIRDLFPHKVNLTSIHFQEKNIRKYYKGVCIKNEKKSFIELINDSEYFMKYDFIVGIDVLDSSNCAWLLESLKVLLKDGGKIVFFESNPWNPLVNIKKFLRLSNDNRSLISQLKLYELFSEIGYVKIFSFYNDFLYAPFTGVFLPYFKNISVLLESMPGLKKFSGNITIHAQKPIKKNYIKKNESLAIYKNLFYSISIVIPCYNEGMNVKSLIELLMKYYDEYIHEIILVNDNSTDNTKDVICKLQKTNNRIKLINRSSPNGVGRALRDGYAEVKGRYCLTMDCDFQHLVTEFSSLFEALNEDFDMVIGSRFSPNSILLNYPFLKVFFNRMFHFSLVILTGNKFRDLTNNLKIIKKEILDRIPINENGFAANAETGIYPMIMGFKICEVPMSWVNRDSLMGNSSFKLMQVGKGYFRVFYKALKYKYLKIKP